MAEISALTPSPPGLGEAHLSPPLPSSSELQPHSPKATDCSAQPTFPKSALYGDPAVMGPVRRAVKEGSQDVPWCPPVSPQTAHAAPLQSTVPVLTQHVRVQRGEDPGTEMGSTAAQAGASQMAESETGPEPLCAEVEMHPSPTPNPTPNLQLGVNVNQAPNPVSEHQDPSLVSPHSSARSSVLPAAGPVEAQENSSQQQVHPPSDVKGPDTPTSPSAQHSFPVPVVHEPLYTFSLPNPSRGPAPDTLSYLESASLMSGTMESLSGLGDDTSSLGSDSEINGMVLRRTDKYGFLGGAQYSEGNERDTKVDVARQREMKWLEMFRNWDKWVSRRFQKVKLRCRKGIPSSLRSKAWQLLSNSSELLESNPGKFEELEREPGDPKWLDIIEKDLHRQFPFHEMFAARGGHGQQDLYRILKAYTVYRPDEGYCQAQAPVAAVLLMHMPAEQAFWCLVQICEKYLPGYYSAGLEAIQLDGEIFFSLLRRVCPMAYRHLKKFKIDPILYMTEWFMCIFSRTLPWVCVLRVWDMFFCEGVKIVFRVGLVLLKQTLGSVEKLRELQGMYETMERLRNIPPESVREDMLVQEVMSLPVTEALIDRESTIQVRKWRESRGELTHQPRRRLHGTRVIYELKYRSAAISSGGSFSYLGGPEPLPGPLRASSSLLSLPGIRKPKSHFRLMGKKTSLTGELPQLPPMKAQWAQHTSSYQAPVSSQPPVQSTLSTTLDTAQGSAQPSAAVAEVVKPTGHDDRAISNKSLAPPQTLMASPRVVSEQITPSLPSPAANNTPLPLPVETASAEVPTEAAAAGTAEGVGEEEGKKKKRNKEEKKKEKEEEKQKAKERKEKEKEEEKQRAKERKEREKQEKDRLKKEKEKTEKRKEKGVKKKEKGGSGEEE